MLVLNHTTNSMMLIVGLKQKGRNQDINVKDMDGYKDFKKQLKRKEQKLAKANEQTEKLDNSSKDIIELLSNLKPMLFSKNNS